MAVPSLDKNFCYYKCRDCGKEYVGYPPDECSCTCRDFNCVMGRDWWWREGRNMVIEEVSH